MADVSEIPDTALTDAIDTLSGIAQPSAGVLSIDQANALGVLIRHALASPTAPDGLIEQARNMLDARGIGPDTVHGPYVGHEDIVQVVAAALATPAPSDRGEPLNDLERDFRWRANQCRTNADAFDTNAAAIWDFAADAVREKRNAL